MKNHKQCYDCYSSVDDIKKCVREGHQVLILMRGVPGCGKTHLAKELLSLRENGIICSTDEYFLDNQGNYNFNIGLLDEYHKKNYNKAREAINNDVTPVIIDNTNIRAEYMKPYIIQACKKFYEIYIVEPKTPWNRKAGQCAAHNTHGVTKEAIMEMLDDMDREQDPSLETLLGKGYKVVLDPPMTWDDEDDDQDMNDISLAQTFAAPSLPILFTPPPGLIIPSTSTVDPILSLHHVPKPVKKIVPVRDMATQATDVTVALSLVGLSDIIDDVVEGEYRECERNVEMPDTKERKTQYMKRETDVEYPTDLDMLVSIYPSEDMSTLYHNYLQYGLIMTIRMNCDVGLMPDHTAEVIAGSFNKEIAKALETGSFEHESIADTYSEANTSTSNSEQIEELEEQIYEVDIGKEFFKQLQSHFGASSNDNGSSSTKALFAESFLRKIYDAVLLQQAIGSMDTPDVDKDAEMARKLQLQENEDYGGIPPKKEMNGAQYIQFQQLLRDYPCFNPGTLQSLYASTGFNTTKTICFLNGTDNLPKQPQQQYAKPAANNVKPAVKRHLPVSRNEVDTPSYFDSTKKNQRSHHFDKAHRNVIQHIENANVIKEKKDSLIGDAYKCHSGSGLKSLYSVVHRQNAATLAKQERAELIKVRDIIFEANRQSKYLDLHYLTQQDALKMVKERLEQLDRKDGGRGPVRNLTIVTGYGKTSGEREIVKKFITGWLTSKQYRYHFSNKGSIEVTCK